MLQENRIWTLMSRKLSGEATVTELEELLEMLAKDPAVYYSMRVIADLWKRKGTTSTEELELAYENHLKRTELHFSHN